MKEGEGKKKLRLRVADKNERWIYRENMSLLSLCTVYLEDSFTYSRFLYIVKKNEKDMRISNSS